MVCNEKKEVREVDIWETNRRKGSKSHSMSGSKILVRGTSKCKDLELGTNWTCSRNALRPAGL